MTKVYVDLDVLLDTRAAVCRTLDKDAMTKWGKAWHGRLFEQDADKRYGVNYTYEEFQEAWKNRDAETILADSIPTKLMWQLDYVISDWQRHQRVGFVKPVFTLTVNTYPYRFEGEALAALAAGVKSYLTESDSVEIIYRDPRSYYPTEIRQSFTAFILDDFPAWHQANMEYLEDNPIPNVLFIVKRFSLTIPDPNDNIMSMFEALELTNAPFMFWRFFNMEWFSYFTPPVKKTPPPQKTPHP